ncbi:MAG: GMC oxidoreductase [Pseudomonadota bacterium]
MMANAKPRIAIIGCGLSGSILALKLSQVYDVEVFERGSKQGEAPSDIQYSGHPVGITPNVYYGKGGTTELWAGGMVSMTSAEWSHVWPEDLSATLPSYYEQVIEILYGESGVEAWRSTQTGAVSGDVMLDRIYYADPYRFSSNEALESLKIHYEVKVTSVADFDVGATVEYENESGDIVRSQFDAVIVASGGLNSPALLLRSDLGGAQVGRNFTDHPMGFVAKVSDCKNTELYAALRNLDDPKAATNQMLKVHDEETGLTSAFYLRAAATGSLKSDPYRRSFKVLAQTGKYRRIAAAISQFHDFDFMFQAVEDKFRIRTKSNYAYVLVVNEQSTDPESTVSLDGNDGVQVNWAFDGNVEKSIKNNLLKLKSELGCDLHVVPDQFSERLYSAAHLSGTCRISDTIENGVVDSNLRVHGAKNIYVCDGSVLPSTGASNTGLTIASLALRLNDYLRSDFLG